MGGHVSGERNAGERVVQPAPIRLPAVQRSCLTADGNTVSLPPSPPPSNPDSFTVDGARPLPRMRT